MKNRIWTGLGLFGLGALGLVMTGETFADSRIHALRPEDTPWLYDGTLSAPAGGSGVIGKILQGTPLSKLCNALQRKNDGRPPAVIPPSASLQVPSSLCGVHAPSLADRASQLLALKSTMLAALANPAANVNGHGVFDGNVDWHSSVHDHWALLSMARMTHDSSLESTVLSRLTGPALDAVRRDLAASPPVPVEELPYGQAWLALLLNEMDRHSSAPGFPAAEVAALRADVEARLLRFLETSPFPDDPPLGAPVSPSQQPYLGAHDSWLFAYQLLKMSHPSGASATQLQAIEATRLSPQRATIRRLSNSLGSGDFFSVPGALQVADQTAPPASPTPGPYTRPLFPVPAPPITMFNAHHSGAAAQTAWPYAMLSARGDAGACRVFNDRVNEMMARSDLWHDDFQAVSHWVPQFIWMGIYLEQGAP